MAKKVILKDDNVEIMPITRGELVLDSSGQQAFHSSQFLATQSQPGLMSGEDKTKLDSLEKVIIEDKKVEQVNTTTDNSYRLLFSNSADDTTKTEGTRKSAKLLFNPSTGALTATALIGKLDWSNLNDVPEAFTPAQHIHNTNEITALTSYSKASSASDLVTTDTLNAALGKLEYKADVAYDWIISVTTADTDKYINKWQEILDFLNAVDNKEGADIIDEFVTRKTGQTITGVKTFSTQQKFIVAQGTSPFTVTSTTKVDNLNADLLDGKHDGEVTAQYFSPGKLLTSSDTINKLMSGIYCYINGDNPTGSVDDNVILLSFRNTGRTDMIQFVGAANTTNLYYRRAANIGNQYENWTSWKTIAFTDSNVASATKLQTARTIWGQLFDGSSDVTGDLLLGAYRILGKDAVDIVNAGSNHLVLGYGSSAKGWPTYVDGDSIYLRYGTSHSDGIFVNSSGKVGIGTTSPTQKLHVAGAGIFYNTSSTTFTTNGITIGAGDVASRYITCYGKTGSSYINVGYGPGTNNSGEFFFNYVSSGSTSNYSGVGIYGGANYMYLYPDYTAFKKPLVMPGELYSGNYAINMSNSDIVGINALYTSDNAESGTEGLQFSRGNGYYDSIWASSGTLYFSPNGNLNRAGSYSTNYTVIHSGNIGSQSVNYATSAGNADTVDSLHASDFVRAYGTYGTSYSYDSDWGQSIVTFDPIVLGTAPAQNPNISILNIGNNYARRKQLAFTYSTNDIYYRRRTDSSWSGWVRLAIAGESYTKGDSDGRYYPISGNVNMSGDNKWIGSTMGGGTDYWRIGGTGTSDNGVCQLTIGDNSNDYFQIIIADYTGTNYTALQVKNGGTYAPHFYENSDQRLKTNIQTILNKDNIPQIKEFDWKESGEHSYGLIAQELEDQGYSELVSTKDDGYKTVNYSAALSLIVGKLQVKIKELEKEIEILKKKN